MILRWVHETARARFRSLGFHAEEVKTSGGILHSLVREGERGKGSIVLVHGLGTSSNTWIRTVPRINNPRRIVAVDLPGFGFSSVSGTEGFATYRGHQAALAEFLAGFDESPLTLVGHSFGGWLCAWYAAENPSRVQHLVLVNSAGVYFRGMEALRDKFAPRSVEETRRLLGEMWHVYPWYLAPFTGAIYRELSSRHVQELVASIEADDLLVEELSRLTMPVSLIWGRNDRIVPVEVVDTLLRLISRVRVHFIEQCGHVPQLEQSAQFAAALNQALQRVP